MVKDSSQAEIPYFDVEIRVEENIGWFYVSV